MLPIQQRRLSLHAPPISGKAPVFLHHAMARHHDRDRVRAAGIRHGTHRFRTANRLGELGVAPRLARRDALQLFPNHLLKRSSAQIERKFNGAVDPFSISFIWVATGSRPASSRRISAALKSCLSSRSNAASLSPNRTAQTPRAVVATSSLPNSVETTVQRISTPSPPRRNAEGVIPSCAGMLSYARLLELYPAS